jgi:type IV pilus assembly protein PilA
LIELLMAVTVTCILGAVVISAYRTYFVRAEVAQGLTVALGWQTAVERAFRSAGQVPADRREVEIPAPPIETEGRYVVAVEVTDGRIDVAYGNEADAAIDGRHLSLTPYETATREVVWVCGNAVPGLGLQPLGFASGGRQPVQASATVEARYLPSHCR